MVNNKPYQKKIRKNKSISFFILKKKKEIKLTEEIDGLWAKVALLVLFLTTFAATDEATEDGTAKEAEEEEEFCWPRWWWSPEFELEDDFFCLLWLTLILILRSPECTLENDDDVLDVFVDATVVVVVGGCKGSSIEALGVLFGLDPSDVPLSQDWRRLRRDDWIVIKGSGSQTAIKYRETFLYLYSFAVKVVMVPGFVCALEGKVEQGWKIESHFCHYPEIFRIGFFFYWQIIR